MRYISVNFVLPLFKDCIMNSEIRNKYKFFIALCLASLEILYYPGDTEKVLTQIFLYYRSTEF